MGNCLANSHSLYLRQHADNKVHWQNWGEAALREAEKRQVPLLVSIGYSACHWCHVMARESFSHVYIAELMNHHFVCVKVDKEAQGHLDRLYREALQTLHIPVGWPLNVFCLPKGQPFFGGTYFPPQDNGSGIIAWPQLLLRVAEVFKKEYKHLEENAQYILQSLERSNQLAIDQVPQTLSFQQAADAVCQKHDDRHGGFGEAPKFPQSRVLGYLLNFRARAEASRLTQRVDTVLNTTLLQLARYLSDPINGGFYRYAVDRAWQRPHFEKMLVDNAALALVFTQASLLYDNPWFAHTARSTLDWLLENMKETRGGFAISLSAESSGEEGAFYQFKAQEIESLLPKEAAVDFCQAYGIDKCSNSHLRCHYEDFAQHLSLAESRLKVKAWQQKREMPTKDRGQSTWQNALVLQALSFGALHLGQSRYLSEGQKLAEHLLTHHFQNKETHEGLYRLYCPLRGPSGEGQLQDYTQLALGLISFAALADLIAPSKRANCLRAAQALIDGVERNFAGKKVGFFTTQKGVSPLPARKKIWVDDLDSCPHAQFLDSIDALNALGLHSGESPLWASYKAVASQQVFAFASSFSSLLKRGGQVLLAGRNAHELRALSELPRCFIALNCLLKIEGKLPAAYQVCAQGTCQSQENLAQVQKRLAHLAKSSALPKPSDEPTLP